MPELTDTLKGYLGQLVERQRSGKYHERMGYKPSHGKHVVLREKEGGNEETAADGITRPDLRKLAAAGMVSLNCPRAAWAVRLRPAAFEASG